MLLEAVRCFAAICIRLAKTGAKKTWIRGDWTAHGNHEPANKGNLPKMHKAIIYCRQSSGKEEESASITFQKDECRKYADTHGYEVIGIYHDSNTPGRLYPSGAEQLMSMDGALQEWLRTHTTEKRVRPGLGGALAILNRVQVLLVYDVTRLYRPVQHSFLATYINRLLMSHKVELVSIKEGRIDFSNFADSLVSSIQQQVNDNQIALTREKSKQALIRLQDSGYYPNMPQMYGIRYIGGRDRAIELIPEQIEVVKFIYSRIIGRTPYSQLLRELNERFKDRHRGKCFYDTSWRHIIANPFYCGYMYDSHGALIPARQIQGKEVIDFETWKRANEIVNTPRAQPHGRRTAIHPFSGLINCGHCGSHLSVSIDNGKQCYICARGVNAVHNPGCSQSRVNIALTRQNASYTGLAECLRPLLLLALYRELEEGGDVSRLQRLIRAKEESLSEVKRKLEELSRHYVSNTIGCYPAYESAYNQAYESHTMLSNDLVALNHDLSLSRRIEKKGRLYFRLAAKVLSGAIDEGQYKDLLHRSICGIISQGTQMQIETIYGAFTLPRYMYRKYRNFPHYDCTWIPDRRGQPAGNFRETRLVVRYRYDGLVIPACLANWPVMRILAT